jgi:hypothetical protein
MNDGASFSNSLIRSLVRVRQCPTFDFRAQRLWCWPYSCRGFAHEPGLRLVLLIGLACIPAALRAPAQQKVGYVLDVRGDWTLRGDTRALEKAKTLPASSVLQNVRPHDEDVSLLRISRETSFKQFAQFSISFSC